MKRVKRSLQAASLACGLPVIRWLWNCSLPALALFLLASSFTSACRGRNSVPPFEDWGFPADFGDYQGQLLSLRLPKAVDRVDWLPSHLQELVASGTAIRNLNGLPESLVSLDISYTDIEILEDLPPSLVELDLTQSKVTDLSGIPPVLSLSLGGTQISSLEGVPSSVIKLSLDDVDLQSLVGLPEGLESLTWKGSRLERADQLPSSLKHLSIDGAGLKELQVLPPKLESLELLLGDDSEVSLEELPPLLVRLELDKNYIPNLSRMRYLRRLDVRRASGPIEMHTLPGSLVQLRVNDESQHVDLKSLPPNIRSLGLVNSRGLDLASLPPGVTSLEIKGVKEGVSLSGMTASLVELDLSWSDFSDTRALPQSIRRLDLSRTEVASLEELPAQLQTLTSRWCKVARIKKLPDSLRVLDVSGSVRLIRIDTLPPYLEILNLAETGVDSLPKLPQTLRSLNISHSRISTLEDLPPGLEHLVIGAHQIQRLGVPPSALRSVEVVTVPDSDQEQNGREAP